jgi:predicted transglutaminase-like cysteine proteinase
MTIKGTKSKSHSVFSGFETISVSSDLPFHETVRRITDRKKSRINGLASILVLAAFSLIAGSFAPVNAGERGKLFLVGQHSTPAPLGFSGLCNRHRWACGQSVDARPTKRANLALVAVINRRVNQQTPQIDDLAQYGIREYWTLPTSRGGDCEDIVLLKKKMLLDQGIPTRYLLIATVLDRNLNNHAVLVFRTKNGDLVLDSLTNKIVPWEKTGYTFLKLQNPNSLTAWQAILIGGVIKARGKNS